MHIIGLTLFITESLKTIYIYPTVGEGLNNSIAIWLNNMHFLRMILQIILVMGKGL